MRDITHHMPKHKHLSCVYLLSITTFFKTNILVTLRKAKVEVMLDLFLWQSTKFVPHYFKLIHSICCSDIWEEGIYCTGFVVTGDKTLFLFRQLPEDTLSDQPVVNAGGGVRGQKQVYNVCAISWKGEQVYLQGSLRDNNKHTKQSKCTIYSLKDVAKVLSKDLPHNIVSVEQ